MFKDLRVRWFVIFVVLLATSYKVWPTYKYYTMSQSDKDTADSLELKKLRGDAINLGLDLQGGMYVLLEADIPILVRKLANKKPDILIDAIKDAENRSIQLQTDFFDEFETIANDRELRLVRYYTELASFRDNSSIMDELRTQRDNAINSALEIIRNRVDEFGVSEPNIQKYGKNRIIVELAGIKDSDRARKLIQRTASLEFTLVLNEQIQDVFDKIDAALLAVRNSTIVEKEDEPTEILNNTVDDIFATVDGVDISNDQTTPDEILSENPFTGYLRVLPGGIGVMENEYQTVKTLLEDEIVKKVIPSEGKLLWGSRIERAQTQEGASIEYRNLFYVRRNPEISGGMVKDPQANIGSTGTDQSGQWVVNLSMTNEGTRKWSRFTGANINRQVAIVLDEKVYMAPFIRDKIPSGRTQISGFSDVNEAKDIANVLRAGELPAPVNIIEERTVGPSLGSDSIDSGSKAMIMGFLLVLVFMILYYKGSGVLANCALLLNIAIVTAVLAGIGATLTLPGIAGLILTIGMAVDANVIIFERIREELDLGKTVKAAIDSGYERAFLTILDANITTLIAAFVLAWIGSGPIKGFAITLSTGIICSMFTAVFITHTIFMTMSENKPLQKLSI